MSEQRQLLAESVTRLFEAHQDAAALSQSGGQSGGWQDALWQEIEALGIPALLVPESSDGIGADWDDACAVLQASGYWQLPLPLVETILARRTTATAGLPLPAGASSISVRTSGTLSQGTSGWRFTGQLSGVPWGRDVASVVAVVPHENVPHVVLLNRADASLRTAENLAGEPRDDLSFEAACVQAAAAADREAASLFDYAALARTAQVSGALQSALDRSIAYARERKQFGKAIGQFQAVQQQLAVLGAEAAAVACAVRAAGIAASSGDASFQIAAAKLRANLAIGVATATAHQVHAAIGFTWEYALRHATQRLWSWRTEYGNDRYWSERLGGSVLARGADAFWSDLTARDDAASA
jgi:acyl-CoA dehydrogenase